MSVLYHVFLSSFSVHMRMCIFYSVDATLKPLSQKTDIIVIMMLWQIAAVQIMITINTMYSLSPSLPLSCPLVLPFSLPHSPLPLLQSLSIFFPSLSLSISLSLFLSPSLSLHLALSIPLSLSPPLSLSIPLSLSPLKNPCLRRARFCS